MAQLDTRIPMQVPNVLAQQAQVTQNNRLAAQSLGEGFNAVQRGMAAPLLREGQALQNQAGNMENMAREQHLLGGVLQGLAEINGDTPGITPQAQAAWAQARGYLVQNGVFEDGELPEALDMETFQGLSAIATMPTQELTDWQRKMQYLTPEQRQQAALVSTGIYPDANAVLRGQIGDRPTTAMQEYEFARSQGFEGTFTEYKQAMRGNGVTVSPDGTVQIGGSPLGRAGQNKVDALAIDTADELARLQRIETSASDPLISDMNTLEGNIKRWGLEWADFVNPEGLNAEQTEYLTKVTQARGDILENVNFTIKQITGAAMTESEAKRIGATLPNVNDSPTMFRAKLDRALNRVRASMARYHMWQAKGSLGEPANLAPLSEVESNMEARYEELSAGVLDGSITMEEAQALYKSEFGL